MSFLSDLVRRKSFFFSTPSFTSFAFFLCQTVPKHVLLIKNISFNVRDETVHDRTGQPVVNRDESDHEQTMLNEVNMDFRIPGLPHSVLKQAQNSRVRELVKKIENHPDRHALQLDLQQDKAHNPFSATAKKMIKHVGNVELFELFETDPKTQCKACLSYWSEGIVYCTCGHLLTETVTNRSFIVYTLDLLSIPENVIKKGRPHGHRYGKAPENKEYYLAHNLKKRCITGSSCRKWFDRQNWWISLNSQETLQNQ